MVFLFFIPIDITNAEDVKQGQTVLIKFGSVAPEGSTWAKVFNKIVGEIEKESRGRIKIVHYIASTMGDDPDMIRKMRLGQLHGMMCTATGTFAAAPEMSVLTLPFLFRKEDEIDYLRERMFDTFADLLKGHGFILLAWVDLGSFVQIFTQKPVYTLDDFTRHMKIYSWAGMRLDKEIMRAIGVMAIPLPIYEVLPALQTGLINAAYGTTYVAVAFQWYKHINYIFKIDLVYGPAVFIMWGEFWDKLPGDLREIIMTKFRKYVPEFNHSVRRDDDTALLGMTRRGIKIIQAKSEMDAGEMEKIAKRGRAVWDKLADDLYPRWLLDEIIKNLEEYRSRKND